MARTRLVEVFEYLGWATLRDSQDEWTTGDAADNLSETAYDAVAGAIADVRNDLQVADLQVVNGSAHLSLAGLRNHRQDPVVEVFHRVAQLAPWSYGLLHVYDDEAANHWVTWVLKRGAVTRESDTYLSPHIGVVEDEL